MLTLVRTDSNHTDFQYLVKQLDQYLAVRNGELNNFFVQFNQIDEIKHVVLAYENNQAVGCSAMKEKEVTTMEVKRMFVPLPFRCKGIAGKMLDELETWAIELGYTGCVLETGKDMTAAVALYSKSGYLPIPNYPPYEEVEDSVCFEKYLGKT